jgi:hypothetical protein
MPEYDHVRAAALEHAVPFAGVRDAAILALNDTKTAAAK